MQLQQPAFIPTGESLQTSATPRHSPSGVNTYVCYGPLEFDSKMLWTDKRKGFYVKRLGNIVGDRELQL